MNVTVDFQHVIFQHVTFQRGDGPPARRNFDRTSKVNTRHSFATCRHPSVLHLRLRYSTPHFPQTQRATVPTTMKKFSLCEALEDWYFNKSQITIKSYKQRIKDMSRWMKENYGETRDIDTMRKRHIRLYINSKAGTATQLRPLKCAIKSCFKHLCKRGVIKIDPAKDFESGKQNPPKFERNLSASDVRLFFKEASKKNDQRTHVMLQILCYGGLRLKVLSQLPCSSIIRTEFLKNKKKRFSLFNCCQKSKGQQVETRCVAQRHWTPSLQLRAVTKQVWCLLIPRKKQEQADASTKCIGTCQANCKEGLPHVSSHFFRHFFCSNALYNGASIADVQAQLGRSSITTTSQYCHSSGQNVSEKISLVMEDDESGDDDSIVFVKQVSKKERPSEKREKNKL